MLLLSMKTKLKRRSIDILKVSATLCPRNGRLISQKALYSSYKMQGRAMSALFKMTTLCPKLLQWPSRYALLTLQCCIVYFLTCAQLWSSHISLELDNQLFKFYEIMNRHALSADSQELLENGGIQLIKAIKRNIVTDHRDVPAVTVHSSTFVGGGAAEPIPQKMPVRSLEHKLYFRGGSLPFEMVSDFQ